MAGVQVQLGCLALRKPKSGLNTEGSKLCLNSPGSSLKKLNNENTNNNN